MEPALAVASAQLIAHNCVQLHSWLCCHCTALHSHHNLWFLLKEYWASCRAVVTLCWRNLNEQNFRYTKMKIIRQFAIHKEMLCIYEKYNSFWTHCLGNTWVDQRKCCQLYSYVPFTLSFITSMYFFYNCLYFYFRNICTVLLPWLSELFLILCTFEIRSNATTTMQSSDQQNEMWDCCARFNSRCFIPIRLPALHSHTSCHRSTHNQSSTKRSA